MKRRKLKQNTKDFVDIWKGFREAIKKRFYLGQSLKLVVTPTHPPLRFGTQKVIMPNIFDKKVEF